MTGLELLSTVYLCAPTGAHSSRVSSFSAHVFYFYVGRMASQSIIGGMALQCSNVINSNGEKHDDSN